LVRRAGLHPVLFGIPFCHLSPNPLAPVSSAAGDFNGDGILDLLLGGSGISEAGNGENSGQLLGHGDGTFTPGPSVSTNGFVAVGDFNGDGKLDIAFTDPRANTVTPAP